MSEDFPLWFLWKIWTARRFPVFCGSRKNALVKQYQKLFGIDGIEIEFTDAAIEKIADLAIARGTGARGLRAIMEEVMLPVMYEAPSMQDVEAVVIDEKVVSEKALPEYRKKTAPRSQPA